MRWTAAFLLVLYAAFVARLTLADPSAGEPFFSWLYGLPITSGDAEALGNIALFVPAAFLLAVVIGRPLLAAALCLVASVGIELVQYRYLPSRVPTIADVQLNGMGGLIGAALAGVVLAAHRWSVPSRTS